MLGTIVNSLAIIVGSLIGVLFGKNFKEKIRITVMNAVGLSVLFVGIPGAVSGLTSEGANPLLFVISLVVGGVLGEWIDIEDKLTKLGNFLQSKLSKKGSTFSAGFVSASLLFCVGTMAILGSIESGVKGEHTILFAKGLIDGIASIVFASTLGIGVALSAVSVFIYQGAITLLAGVIEPYLTADMIREINIVGSIMLTGLGINLLEIKTVKIKIANMLPAIFIPVVYYLIVDLIN